MHAKEGKDWRETTALILTSLLPPSPLLLEDSPLSSMIPVVDEPLPVPKLELEAESSPIATPFPPVVVFLAVLMGGACAVLIVVPRAGSVTKR